MNLLKGELCMNAKKAKELIEKYAWPYENEWVVINYHNRKFLAPTKNALLQKLINFKPQKCPLFDNCGRIFKGVQPHHKHCHDFEYAKQQCDLLRSH